MEACPHTGVQIPECSCRSCLQAQLERHRPPPRAEASVTPIRGPRLMRRLRELRGRRAA